MILELSDFIFYLFIYLFLLEESCACIKTAYNTNLVTVPYVRNRHWNTVSYPFLGLWGPPSPPAKGRKWAAVSTWLPSLLYNNRQSHNDQALSYKSSFTKSTKSAYIYKYIQKSHFKNVQNIPFCTNVEKYPVWLFQACFQIWFSTLDTAVGSYS